MILLLKITQTREPTDYHGDLKKCFGKVWITKLRKFHSRFPPPLPLPTPCKEIRMSESGKCLNVGPWSILRLGILNTVQGMRNPTDDWIQVPLIKNPVSSTWNPESTAWNPESKTVLDSLTWGNDIIHLPSII